MQDKSMKFNPLGLFVMQTIAMWEESSKLPEMRDVRFDVAIEILRNTYPVRQLTGCACDESGPCKAHGKPTPPAPIAAQTEKPWNCICSVAFGVTPEKCGAHATPAPADTGANWIEERFKGIDVPKFKPAPKDFAAILPDQMRPSSVKVVPEISGLASTGDTPQPQELWEVVSGQESDNWGIRKAGESYGKSIAQMLWENDAKHIVNLHNAALGKTPDAGEEKEK